MDPILPTVQPKMDPRRRSLLAWLATLAQTIRGRILIAFLVMSVITGALGGYAALGIRRAGILVAKTFDESLMSINYARAAAADFAAMQAVFARRLPDGGPGVAAPARRQAKDPGDQSLTDDLAIAAERSQSAAGGGAAANVHRAAAAWKEARTRLLGGTEPDAWSALDRYATTVDQQVDLLVNYTAGDGFLYRQRAQAAVSDDLRLNIIGTALALLLSALGRMAAGAPDHRSGRHGLRGRRAYRQGRPRGNGSSGKRRRARRAALRHGRHARQHPGDDGARGRTAPLWRRPASPTRSKARARASWSSTPRAASRSPTRRPPISSGARPAAEGGQAHRRAHRRRQRGGGNRACPGAAERGARCRRDLPGRWPMAAHQPQRHAGRRLRRGVQRHHPAQGAEGRPASARTCGSTRRSRTCRRASACMTRRTGSWSSTAASARSSAPGAQRSHARDDVPRGPRALRGGRKPSRQKRIRPDGGLCRIRRATPDGNPFPGARPTAASSPSRTSRPPTAAGLRPTKTSPNAGRPKPRIAFMARHDALTGLPNRVLFGERIDQALAHRPRQRLCRVCPRPRPLQAGQRHARPSGRRRAALRGGGTAAGLRARNRYRRAAWAATSSPSCSAASTQPEDAAILARRIVEVVSAPYEIDGHRVTIGISIGISLAPGDGRDLREAAEERRRRALPRQDGRPRHLALLRAGDGRPPAGPPRARARSARGARERASSSCSTSRSTISSATASAASRRCCAGTIRCAAWSRRPSSSRSPRRSA